MRRTEPLQLLRVVRDVGEGDRAEALARRRVEVLARLDHPGLVLPLDVRRDGEAVQVCSPRVAAPTLGQASGEGLGDRGAWAWIMVGIADALACIHAAGLAHGDVSPENVLVGERPLLIDLVGPALGAERGTPGLQAPERGLEPMAAADVYALGALGRLVAHPSIATEVDAWTAPLLAQDPAARPTAADVAAALPLLAPPRPWQPASSDARSHLRAAAPEPTEKDPAAWGWRLRRRSWVLAVAAGAACAAAGLWHLAPAESEPAVAVAAEEAAPDPARAAEELTRTRLAALAAGDGAAVASLAVPGSSAWAALARDARSLAEGASVAGAAEAEVEATLVEDGGTRATVEVTTRWPERAGRDGTAATEDALLTLEWSGERWRVSAVSAAP